MTPALSQENKIVSSRCKSEGCIESSTCCGICYSPNVGQDLGRDLQVCNDCGAHQAQGGWQTREPGKTSYKGIQWPGVEADDGFVPSEEPTRLSSRSGHETLRGKTLQLSGAAEGSVRAINFPGGYSSIVSGVAGSGFTIVSTFPLTTPLITS